MAYSTLRRKTPLRAGGGFKPRQPLEKKPKGLLPARGCKTPSDGAKRPASARKESRSSMETHLDIVFSLYIRLRDAMPGGMTRCISCGRVLPFGQMQCGHYHTRHSRSVRWDERNCNAECSFDNCNNPDHLEGYRRNLIAKIGQEAFDELNVLAHQSRKWSGDELRDMIVHYTDEVRRLSKEKGINVKI